MEEKDSICGPSGLESSLRVYEGQRILAGFTILCGENGQIEQSLLSVMFTRKFGMYMHLGDIKFVKLCLQCPLVDFTNALVDVIGRPDVGFDFDFKPYAGEKIRFYFINH